MAAYTISVWNKRSQKAPICEGLYFVQTNSKAVQILLAREVWSRKKDVLVSALDWIHVPEECTHLYGRYKAAPKFERPRKHTQNANDSFPMYNKKDSTKWLCIRKKAYFRNFQRELFKQTCETVQWSSREILVEPYFHARKARYSWQSPEIDKDW